MNYIRGIFLDSEKSIPQQSYLSSLPAVKNLDTLNFHSPVTIFTGENGSGKSTLLEALATGYGLNPEGGSKNFNFSTYHSHSELEKYIRISKGVSLPQDSFFLRAESFYNLATNIEDLDLIDSFGGKSLHEQSHGESFFSLFMHRLWGNGMYILDEPESALSPQRQLSFLLHMKELIDAKSQFIIATHSPILLAYPEADIIEISENGYTRVSYEETKNFELYNTFFQNKESLFRKLGLF